MTNRAFLLLGLVTFLACGCLALAYAALYSEYAEFRDGARVTGTVTRSEPHRAYVKVEIVPVTPRCGG